MGKASKVRRWRRVAGGRGQPLSGRQVDALLAQLRGDQVDDDDAGA